MIGLADVDAELGRLGLCPVGTCTNLSLDGEPCEECLELFDGSRGGWLLRRVPARPAPVPVPAPRMAPAVETRIARRVAAAAPPAVGERRANQQCWLCETRHRCTRVRVGAEFRWECDGCRQVAG